MDATTEATRTLLTELFDRYESEGTHEPLFERVAEDVRWTAMGSHPLAGAYTSKQQFLDSTYGRLEGVLEQPIKCKVTRILADGEWAVVEWRGEATSVKGEPFDNVYCWLMRVVDGWIVEVRAYVDSALVVALFESVDR